MNLFGETRPLVFAHAQRMTRVMTRIMTRVMTRIMTRVMTRNITLRHDTSS
jgi:hypothetical protein